MSWRIAACQAFTTSELLLCMWACMFYCFFFCSLERESSWGVREFSTLEDSSFFAVELHLVSSRCLMPNVLGTSYPDPHFFQVGGVCEMSHWSGESFRNRICRFNLSFLLLWPSFEICQCRKPLLWIFDEYYISNDKRMLFLYCTWIVWGYKKNLMHLTS